MEETMECVKIKWQGDHSAYRRLVPNTYAKEFVATHVKTPTAAALIKEMAAVHSMAEASVQPAGSLEEASALSGTDQCPPLGVAFAPAVDPAVELLLDPQEHELSVGVAVVVAAAAPSFDDRRRVGANGGRVALLNRRVPRPLVQWVAHQDLQNR